MAPPAFLRTLAHGNAVMLTGNLPPALVTTHGYYQQARWRRHVPAEILEQHRRIHGPAGATTREILEKKGWVGLRPAGWRVPPGHRSRTRRHVERGRAVEPSASDEYVLCDSHEREL